MVVIVVVIEQRSRTTVDVRVELPRGAARVPF